jgi:hypothetical protein
MDSEARKKSNCNARLQRLLGFNEAIRPPSTDLHAAFSDFTTNGILNFRQHANGCHALRMDGIDTDIGGAVRRQVFMPSPAFDQSIVRRCICERSV